jgi:hypothetical protein
MTVTVAGLVLAFASRWSEVLEEARTYALLAGLVGLANVVVGAVTIGRSETPALRTASRDRSHG